MFVFLACMLIREAKTNNWTDQSVVFNWSFLQCFKEYLVSTVQSKNKQDEISTKETKKDFWLHIGEKLSDDVWLTV